MLRHDRARFLLYAGPLLLNILGLLGHALGIATRGGGAGERISVPLDLALAAICLLLVIPFAIKRGRDLGWPPLQSAGAVALVVLIPPAGLVFLLLLALLGPRKRAESFGPPPAPASITIVIPSLLLFVWPWVIVAASGGLAGPR